MTNAVEPRLTLNRDAVVRAAGEFADVHGLDELTLTRVARTLGVSLPALYNHVRSSSDCTSAIALEGLDDLTRRLARAQRSVTDEAALQAVASAWRSFAAERPGVYAAIHRRRWSDEAAVDSGARLVALLRSVVLDFGGDERTATDAAWAIAAALHGFVAAEAEGAHPPARNSDRAFSQLVDLLCQGLRSAAIPHPARST